MRSLVIAADNLRIARLRIICKRLLEVRDTVLSRGNQQRAAEDLFEGDPGAGSGDPDGIAIRTSRLMTTLEFPRPSLARDLSALLGDELFSDVRFISTESRRLHAHRCILESHCEYLRAMFRFRRDAKQPEFSAGAAAVDVMVPDTFVGLTRLLLFLYSDNLPDGSDDTVIQDLLAADRYGPVV